ncbi:MAG: ABC transporter permease [Methanosarcinales archaeon]|jgi:NitT/TauT family transport system permease protein|nr:ABC transporter permease [Methanosarcinales archaeon]
MESQNVQKITVGALSLAAFAILWELLSAIIHNSFYLPRFSNVISAFFGVIQTATFFNDVGISLYHFLIGFFFALLIGVPIGMLMGWFPILDKAFNPIVEIFRPIPPLAWIPFAIIWLKLTHQAAGFIIFMGMLFPIIISTYSGFKNVPKIYVEAAKVLGSVSNLKLIKNVAIPAASPMILSGIKTAMGVGWMCLAASEMFGVSDTGVGYKIWFYYGIQAMDHVVVYMLILGFIGLLLDFLFRYFVQNRILKWQTGTVI